MALPWIIANLAAGNQPASKLDDNFNALGAIATIPCVATGTNAITLTPLALAPTISAYGQLQAYRFVAAASTTGVVTIQVNAIGFLPAYMASPTAAVIAQRSSLVIGVAYDAVYDLALNSGAGGFHIFNVSFTNVVQVQSSPGIGTVTSTAIIPFDNTKPQSSEGTQIFGGLIFRPRSITNVVRIQVLVNYAISVTTAVPIIALFDGLSVDALAAAFGPQVGSANQGGQISIDHYYTPATLSSLTYSANVGIGSAATITVDGQSGAGKFGGVLNSRITAIEYAA